MKYLEALGRWALTSVVAMLAALLCLVELGQHRRQRIIAGEAVTISFRQYAAAMAHQRQERSSGSM